MKRETRTNYQVAFFICLFHAGFIVALFNVSWPAVALAALVWGLAGSPGIGVGFHRLLTHRGFKTPVWAEYALTVIGCLALQGGPITWVSAHRKHHQFAEQPGLDPHTPKEGLFWAHMLWMIRGDPKLRTAEIRERYAPDLCNIRFHRVMNRIWWLPMTLFGLALWYLTSFTVTLWAIAVPTVILWHCTWLVNSATHRWGSRRFDTPDNSRNLGWLALVTFGEAWHNNHHEFPWSARHGLAWYELDPNWVVIRLLRFLGLAWEVREAKQA